MDEMQFVLGLLVGVGVLAAMDYYVFIGSGLIQQPGVGMVRW